MVARGWGEKMGGQWGVTANGNRGFLLGGDQTVWNESVVMVTQLCKYTKNHWIVRFKNKILIFLPGQFSSFLPLCLGYSLYKTSASELFHVLDLSYNFLMIRFRLYFWRGQDYYIGDVVNITSNAHNVTLSHSNAAFDHLVKMMHVRSCHCKGTLFSL